MQMGSSKSERRAQAITRQKSIAGVVFTGRKIQKQEKEIIKEWWS
jgi:hypothetical protein